MKKANTKIKSLKVKSFTTKEAKKLQGGVFSYNGSCRLDVNV